MRVFVTGATGWVGSHVVKQLLAAGHDVDGLARADAGATALRSQGATARRGSLDDLDVLRAGAEAADAVLHLAFNHDFSRYAENATQDRRAIEAIGDALVGSDKALLVTSGVAMLAQGRAATEADVPQASASFPRRSEEAASAFAGRGVRAATVRLASTVHGVGEGQAFVPTLMRLARETGVSAYIGDGANRWPAVHVDDAARVYVLALQAGVGERVYHAVAEDGITFRTIAEAIGRRLGVPAEPRDGKHFGWLGGFAGADMPASSARTRAALAWTPGGPTLLDDIANPAYAVA